MEQSAIYRRKVLLLLEFSLISFLEQRVYYGTREQRRKIARKPFAHIEKPCSMRLEQCGTNGTMLGTRPIY
jgi:hypothetical protein